MIHYKRHFCLGKNIFVTLIFFISFIFCSSKIYGQGFRYQALQSQGQYQSGAGMMSYDQLELFWFDAQRKGYDLNTIPVLLQESGYSPEESLNITRQIRSLEQSRYGYGSPLGFDSELSEEDKKIFGLSIFRNSSIPSDNAFNLPTPENYTLGVGDQLSVLIYGETDANYTLQVNKEGKVAIPFIGPFSLQGLSLKSAKALVKQKLEAIHSGLIGENPTVFMDLSLTNLRSITISILGEASRPGSYSISSNSSLLNALYSAQGPSRDGTLRNIKVYRSNKLLHEVDLYEYLTQGIVPNISLKDQDVIFIDTYQKRVEILGGVKRPGIYELKDEKISQLIELAGGFRPGSDKNRVILKRQSGPNQFVRSVDLNFSSDNMEDGDLINIDLIDDYVVEKVKITGAVNRPGFHNFSNETNLEDLLISAGGFRDDALINRIAIFQNKNSLKPTIKVINAEEEDLSDIYLKDINSVFVPSVLELTESDYVTIEGSVNRNGQIPYYEGMTVLDAIIFANGIDYTALEGKIEVVRNKSLQNNEGYDFYVINIPLKVDDIEEFELKPRDKIFVRDNWLSSYDKTVVVTGEVGQPGSYVINPGVTKVSDIIERTGKYPSTANLDGLKLYRAVQTVNDNKEDSKLERTNSINDFINDSRFEGSVSTVQGKNILRALENLKNSNEEKNDSILPSQGSRIEKLNGFELSQEYLVKEENIEFLEIGLSYDEILVNPNSQYNVALLDGDILFVPPKANLVEIDGNVFSPTQAIFRKEKKFIDYIETAGGFRSKSDIRRSYIEYSNGEIKRVKSFLLFRKYPEVKTDSRIVVPQRPPGATFNFDRLISLITSTISTYLLIQAVSTPN